MSLCKCMVYFISHQARLAECYQHCASYHIGAHILSHRGEDRRKDMAETRKILSGHVGRKVHVTGPSARIGLCI